MKLPSVIVVPMPLIAVVLLLAGAAIVVRISIRYPSLVAGLQAAAPFLAAALAILLAAWGLLS
jgi:hypothetical protein